MRSIRTKTGHLGRAGLVLGVSALAAVLSASRAAYAEDTAPDASSAPRRTDDSGRDPAPPAYAPAQTVAPPPAVKAADYDGSGSERATGLRSGPSTVSAGGSGYGGQIVLADLAGLALGGVLSAKTGNAAPILLGWTLASPVVHGIHGHAGRSVMSALLHVGLPLIGGYVGVVAENCPAHPIEDDFCGLGGALAGGALGMIAATVVDAAVLGQMTDEPSHRVASSGGTASAPALSVGRNGDVSVGWRGTF